MLLQEHHRNIMFFVLLQLCGWENAHMGEFILFEHML